MAAGAQYGWTVDRLQGVLAVLVLLCGRWGILSASSGVKGKIPLSSGQSEPCGFVIGVGDTGASNSPVLDSMRISVNSHMARYQAAKTRQTR